MAKRTLAKILPSVLFITFSLSVFYCTLSQDMTLPILASVELESKCRGQPGRKEQHHGRSDLFRFFAVARNVHDTRGRVGRARLHWVSVGKPRQDAGW